MSIGASYRRVPPEEFQRLADDNAQADAYLRLEIDRVIEDDDSSEAYYDRLMARERRLNDTGQYL